MFEKEPRNFETHTCRGCKATLSGEQLRSHSVHCDGKLDRHGPDFKVIWPANATPPYVGTIYYDITVVHVTSPSYNLSGAKADALIKEQISRKAAHYALNGLTSESLVVIPVRAHGGLPPVTVGLLQHLAVEADRLPKEVIAEFSFVLQLHNGESSRLAGPRRFVPVGAR